MHEAVLQACDGLDGVKDGILENPLTCRFDPKVLQCKAGEDSVSCLTPAQVQSAKAIYAPSRDPKTGKVLTGGLMPGTELQWGTLYSPQGYGNAIEAMKYIAMKDPSWDPATFNAATDVEKAQKADPEGVLKSDNPNVKAFFDRGGKLLMYQGFADPQVTSDNAIRYHQAVLDKVGRHVALPGRAGHRYVRQGRGARRVGDHRQGARSHRRVTPRRRQGRSHAAAVRVPEGREVDRQRQRRRGAELRVRGRRADQGHEIIPFSRRTPANRGGKPGATPAPDDFSSPADSSWA